jgi:ABC-type sugar transport system permease subunit
MHMQRTIPLPGLKKMRGRKRLSRLALREALAAYGFLTPFLIILGVFTLIATAAAFYLSFFYVDLGFTQPIFTGLRNYQIVWYDLTHNGDYLVSIINVVKYTIFVVVVQTALALALALLLNTKVRGRGIFRTSFYLPALTSSVAISLIFIWLYRPDGPINYVLSLIHIHGPNWLGDPNTALWSIGLLNIWTTAPTFMLFYLAALQDIPDTLIEAARVDGASNWRIVWNILFPLLRPTTFAIVALGSIGAMQLFDQAFLMGGAQGGPLRSTLTPVLEIYDTAFQSSLMGLACAMAVILFVVIFTFTMLQKRFIDTTIEY